MGEITSQASITTHGASSEMMSISSKILVASIIIVFLTLALLFVVHIYAKWYWSRHAHEDPRVAAWRRRVAHQGHAGARTRGLDPEALKLAPEVEFDPKGFKDGLECAVCLSEVTQGEKIRLLPKCSHGFHVTCIDTWFHSHTTCPLCRNPMIFDQNPSRNHILNDNELPELDSSSSSESETDDDDDSENACPRPNEESSRQVRLFGQSLEEASTSTTSSNNSSNGVNRQRDVLVIDIPRQVLCEECLSSPQLSPNCGQESKSPVLATLKSLRRLLSRGNRVAPSPRGSSSGETEQV